MYGAIVTSWNAYNNNMEGRMVVFGFIVAYVLPTKYVFNTMKCNMRTPILHVVMFHIIL